MRIRTLVRKHKWTPVSVSPKKVEGTPGPYGNYGSWQKFNDENSEIFKNMSEWCRATVGEGNYACSLHNGTSMHNTKQFAFKFPKHATLFKLRWL